MDATDHLAARIVAGARHTLSRVDAATLIRAHVNVENAKLREIVLWAFDNGYTPPTISRDDHKKLAGL